MGVWNRLRWRTRHLETRLKSPNRRRELRAVGAADDRDVYRNQDNSSRSCHRKEGIADDEQRHIEDVSAGEELPAMVKNASRAQLFLFSAATNNPHRIHYDREYAAVEGHPDVLVHGPLQGAWLHQFVAEWAGPKGRVSGLSWQNRARAFPESDLTFRGRVTEIEASCVLESMGKDASGAVNHATHGGLPPAASSRERIAAFSSAFEGKDAPPRRA